MLHFVLNDSEIKTDLPAGTILLDYIRYTRQLTGTKIGCREGDCGACTILVGELRDGEVIYSSATSCLMPIGSAAGKHIVTVEGINVEGLNTVQQAFSEEGATQCGFCTPGFIVSLTGFALSNGEPSYPNAIDSLNGNICRCTGYKSIERAAKKVSENLLGRGEKPGISYAVGEGFVPSYFLKVAERLSIINKEELPAQHMEEEVKFVGGGTDLYVQQPEHMASSKINILFGKPELRGIRQKDNICEMGGSTTVADMAVSPIFIKHFPSLQKIIKLVSSTPIRNMATLGGNFTNASPIGDLTIFFLALDAQLVLHDQTLRRILPLRSFYHGYKQLAKTPAEYIEKINFELPTEDHLFNFEKVCKRTNLDIASVNTAISISVNEGVITSAGLSAGGVGPIPLYLSEASNFLRGKVVSADVIFQLLEIIQSEISPISDVRGTETYKRLLLSQLVKAHFISLFPDLPAGKILANKL